MAPGVTLQSYVIAVKTVQLVCGGLLTALAVRAYRETTSRSLGTLAAGLGLVTAGPLVGGIVYQLTPIGFAVGIALESTGTAAGIGTLAYSLYAEPGDRIPVHATTRGHRG